MRQAEQGWSKGVATPRAPTQDTTITLYRDIPLLHGRIPPHEAKKGFLQQRPLQDLRAQAATRHPAPGPSHRRVLLQ